MEIVPPTELLVRTHAHIYLDILSHTHTLRHIQTRTLTAAFRFTHIFTGGYM